MSQSAIHWIDITPNLLLIITFFFGFIKGLLACLAADAV